MNALNLKRVETAIRVDPLFHKTSAAFDEVCMTFQDDFFQSSDAELRRVVPKVFFWANLASVKEEISFLTPANTICRRSTSLCQRATHSGPSPT